MAGYAVKMALSISQTIALGRILKAGMKVSSLGYPDLVAPFHYFEQMLGDKVHLLEYRKDSEAICKRHGLRNMAIPDAESFFKLMDCELDVYDIVQERGCEIQCDLNYPWASLGRGGDDQKYDVVLDVGTVEHCFNISQAIMNMASLVKEGGYIIHENPFNWGNHGFYNLNPTWYHDFYVSNGFKLLDCKLVLRDGTSIGCPSTSRFRYQAEEANVFAMAQRVTIQLFVFPVQSKYAKLIPAAGVKGEKEVVNA